MRRVELYSASFEEFYVRAHARADDEEVRRKARAVVERHGLYVPLPVELRGARLLRKVEFASRLLKERLVGLGRRLVELERAEPVFHLDYAAFHAALRERVGGVEADEAGADYYAFLRLLRRIADFARVVRSRRP